MIVRAAFKCLADKKEISALFLVISKKINLCFCLEMGSDRFYLFKEVETELGFIFNTA